MINISKILKDAPQGMKLYSPLFGEVEFCAVDTADSTIVVRTEHGDKEWFSTTGKYKINKSHFLYSDSECLLFPSKECRNWETWLLPTKPMFKVGDWVVRGSGFVYEPLLITEIRDYYICELQNGERVTYTLNDVYKNFHLWTIQDAKDGDVLSADECYVIFKEIDGLNIKCYCTYHYMGFNPSFHINTLQNKTAFKPATSKERTLLFKKMQEAGYQWYAGKKELKKIQPHYDISNFHAGMPVLVRETSLNAWQYVPFSHCYIGGDGSTRFNAGLVGFTQCIPFDGNEHMVGTTNMPDECYINW